MLILQIVGTLLIYIWGATKDSMPITNLAKMLDVKPETLDTIVSEVLIEVQNPNPAQLLAHLQQLISRINPTEIMKLMGAVIVLLKSNVFNAEQMGKLKDFIQSLKMSDETRQKINDAFDNAWQNTKEVVQKTSKVIVQGATEAWSTTIDTVHKTGDTIGQGADVVVQKTKLFARFVSQKGDETLKGWSEIATNWRLKRKAKAV